MKIKKPFFIDVLAWIHATLIFAPLFMLFGYFGRLEGINLFKYASLGLLLLIPVITSHYMLRKIRHFSLYIILSFALSTCGFIYGFTQVTYFGAGNILAAFMLFALFLAIYLIRGSAKIQHSDIKKDFDAVHGKDKAFMLEAWEMQNFLNTPKPFHWAWFIILYLSGLGFKQHFLIVEVFYIMILDVFICFVHRYYSNFHQYIKTTDQIVNMPISTMKRVHISLFYIGLIAVTIAILPALLYGKEPLESVHLGNGQQITEMSEDEYMRFILGEPDTSNDMENILKHYEKKDPPKWIAKLFAFLVYLSLGIFITLVLIALIKGLQKISKDFNEDDQDDILYLDDIVDEKARIATKDKNPSFLSPNLIIRKKYKKLISKRTEGKPKKYASPTELEKDANLEGSSYISLLHSYYEKARYSKDGISKDELNSVKTK